MIIKDFLNHYRKEQLFVIISIINSASNNISKFTSALWLKTSFFRFSTIGNFFSFKVTKILASQKFYLG